MYYKCVKEKETDEGRALPSFMLLWVSAQSLKILALISLLTP